MNIYRIKRCSALSKQYIYVDVPDYLADQLFEKHHVHVRYGSEFANAEHRYRIITCLVWRWEDRRFKAAMKDLINLMAYSGKGDYLQFCEKLWAQLQEQMNKLKKR